MILIRTCWYLSVMFFVMLGCASAITVAPGGESTMGIIMLLLVILSLFSGVTAFLLRRRFKRNPEAVIFRSKVVSGICIGIAAVLTFFLVFGVIG